MSNTNQTPAEPPCAGHSLSDVPGHPVISGILRVVSAFVYGKLVSEVEIRTIDGEVEVRFKT